MAPSLRKTDLTVYVFVLAVLLSGIWLVEQIGSGWSPALLGVTALVAAGWTAYHRYRVEPHLGGTEEGGRGGASDPDTGAGRPEATGDDRRRDAGARE